MDIEEFNIDGVTLYGDISIYGATYGGKVIYQILKRKGISIKCFYDRCKKGSVFCGLPVCDPKSISNEDSVIIALTRSFKSAYKFLKMEKDCKICRVTELIENTGLDDIDYNFMEKEDILNFLNEYSFYSKDSEFSKEIFFPILEVFITEKCTLKCRDCSHLIPYYKDKRNYDIQEIIRDLECVFKVIDKIYDLCILGGEPLMHPELYQLIDWLVEQPKIEKISIISNGTIIPSKRNLDSIKQSGTRIRISDYREYSVNLNKLIEICEENNIVYFVNQESWVDMGKTEKHNYTENELKDMFLDCPFANAFLLLKGKLYRCPHIAHLDDLDISGKNENDFVDFGRKEDSLTIKKRLVDFMNTDILYGCQFCNGIQNGKTIDAAIQMR